MATPKCNRKVVLDLPYSAWRARTMEEIIFRQEQDVCDEQIAVHPFTFATIPPCLIGGEDTVVLRSPSLVKS